MEGMRVTWVDSTEKPYGTASNPVIISAGGGAAVDTNVAKFGGTAVASVTAGSPMVFATTVTMPVSSVTLGYQPSTTNLIAVFAAQHNVAIAANSVALDVRANIIGVGGSALAIGQGTMATSFPVVFASNQSALSVTSTTDYAQGSVTAGQIGPLMQGSVTTAVPAYTNLQTSPLSLTTSGGLRTTTFLADSGGTARQPVAKLMDGSTFGNTFYGIGSVSATFGWDIANNTRSMAVYASAQSRTFTTTDQALETRAALLAINNTAIPLADVGNTAGMMPVQNVLTKNSNGTFSSQGDLSVASARVTSAVNTANAITLAIRNLATVLAIKSLPSAGTADLTIEGSVDNVNFLVLETIAAAASTVKQYNNTTVGATVALSPLAFEFIRITAGSAGAGNTTLLTVSVK